MSSEVKKNLAKRVAAAVIPLGLPIPSVGPLLMALASQDPTAMMMVPGVSLPIIGAATDATMKTYAAAFRYVYSLQGASDLEMIVADFDVGSAIMSACRLGCWAPAWPCSRTM
jgi:hypothetical protein